MTQMNERPQDVGRTHRRRGAPSPETAELLTAYQDAMRTELRALLVEIRGKVPEPGLGLVATEPVRPAIEARRALWALAIQLGRELGSAIDADPVPVTAEPGPRARRRPVDFG
jgi:hypothetical protein